MITAHYVNYNLLNHKKDISQKFWIFDFGPWDDTDLPSYHKEPFRAKFQLSEAVDVYSRLLKDEKIHISQLLNTTKYSKARYRLANQLTQNFPEVVLKDSGVLGIDYRIKKDREFYCKKASYHIHALEQER